MFPACALSGCRAAPELKGDPLLIKVNNISNVVAQIWALQDIKRAANYVSQLRRVGKGLGVFEFDRYLSEEAEEAA